ncbi:Uu.00g137850.m01.CDS01 [Anthostomella pinea]|uniref:Uu.00g137850.m01.CDS01 n=1 Tax=Anthostomella pinea TaxID=933095 RepID=A0AAI8VQD3_9PEZI|nr:Uu.00g137850.m01.CDS01 [Anthostomella pinea]
MVNQKRLTQITGPCFLHQTTYSDGEIYRGKRLCQLAKQDLLAREWTVQLSSSKQPIVRQLSRNIEIVKALDKLLPYPGLWTGLRIDNLYKYLALQCVEQILNYLGHIHHVWSTITVGIMPETVDNSSVGVLQGRAPSVATDRIYIEHMFNQNQIFVRVSDPATRSRLLERILSLGKMIPSIWTFEKSMKYFELGARILRRELFAGQENVDPEANVNPGTNVNPEAEEPTLLQRLKWQNPMTPTVEVAEGVFVESTVITKEKALKALFLFPLRHFPFLGPDPLLQNVKGEGIVAGLSDLHSLHLRARAREFGFVLSTLDQELCQLYPLVVDPVSTKRRSMPWRGGKPFVSTFFELRPVAFLPTLDAADPCSGVTPAFVLKHFMDAYFGASSYAMDVPDSMDESGMSSHSLPAPSAQAPVGSPRSGEGTVHLPPIGSQFSNKPKEHHGRAEEGARHAGEPVGDNTKEIPVNGELWTRPPNAPTSRESIDQFDVQLPDRSAQRSPIFTPEPEGNTQASLEASAGQSSLAGHASSTVFRPGVALDASVFSPPTHPHPRPRTYLKKEHRKKDKEKRGLNKIRKKSLGEPLSTGGKGKESMPRPRRDSDNVPADPQRDDQYIERERSPPEDTKRHGSSDAIAGSHTPSSATQGASGSRRSREGGVWAQQATSSKEVTGTPGHTEEHPKRGAFARTKEEYPVYEDWPSDTEIPVPTRERSAPASSEDDGIL